jgi:hypothetical protein
LPEVIGVFYNRSIYRILKTVGVFRFIKLLIGTFRKCDFIIPTGLRRVGIGLASQHQKTQKNRYDISEHGVKIRIKTFTDSYKL